MPCGSGWWPLRQRTSYGPRRLAYCLSREGIPINMFGAYRMLQRAGLVRKRRSHPRKRPICYAMAVPGQRVQVDVKYLPPLRLKNRPEHLQEYLSTPLSMIAPASRYPG